MRGGVSSYRQAPPLKPVGLGDEWPGHSDLLREQAAEIAHFKKMYDRSSALAKIGVWECDLATETLIWTDGVYDLFELPRGSLLDRAQIVALYDDDSRREMERLRAAAIRDGGSFVLDILIRTARGNERWLRLTADVEREDGRSVRIFGTKQDITEEKAAQDKVRALQAELIHLSRRSAMGAMAATLAHELNQPLTAIGNYVAGSRRALGLPEPNRDLLDAGLESIGRCALRAGNIIRSLRAVAGDKARRERVAVNALVKESAALALSGPSDGAGLRYDLGDNAIISADPIQIQQVLIALVKNALEASRTSPRHEVSISTSIAAGTVIIRVDDSGPGLPAETLKTLFDSRGSSKPDGMGVGLSVSRTIIEAHGGKIAAENRAGGGASFRVTLPLAKEDDGGH